MPFWGRYQLRGAAALLPGVNTCYAVGFTSWTAPEGLRITFSEEYLSRRRWPVGRSRLRGAYYKQGGRSARSGLRKG